MSATTTKPQKEYNFKATNCEDVKSTDLVRETVKRWYRHLQP